jgi:hypothetical protein
MQVRYEPWDYKNEIEDLWGVTITDGEFAGTSISFNSMDLKEDSQDLQLDYTVVKVAPGKEKSEISGPEFEKALSFIIQDILEKAIEHYGEDNTTKSGQ